MSMDASPTPLTTRQRLKDLAELAKPSILILSVMMAALGLWMAPEPMDVLPAVIMLLGTGLVVGSANALNMVLERETDGFMARTRNRPLPAGRMSASLALWFGVALGLVGTVLLYASAGWLTAALGAGALLAYVLVYTPLKRRTTHALLIGAFPGAMPPLMGWAAATQTIDIPGLALFGILLLWQMPHFLAIAVYREKDYAAAGIRTVAVVRGAETARLQTLVYATALVPVTIALFPLGVAGWLYGLGSLGVSVWFLVKVLQGYRTMPAPKWARRVFLASLVYLPALGAVLILDRLAG